MRRFGMALHTERIPTNVRKNNADTKLEWHFFTQSVFRSWDELPHRLHGVVIGVFTGKRSQKRNERCFLVVR